MVTDGASFKAFNSIFSNNAVPIYGSLGGAIWLSACQAYVSGSVIISCFLGLKVFTKELQTAHPAYDAEVAPMLADTSDR